MPPRELRALRVAILRAFERALRERRKAKAAKKREQTGYDAGEREVIFSVARSR